MGSTDRTQQRRRAAPKGGRFADVFGPSEVPRSIALASQACHIWAEKVSASGDVPHRRGGGDESDACKDMTIESFSEAELCAGTEQSQAEVGRRTGETSSDSDEWVVEPTSKEGCNGGKAHKRVRRTKRKRTVVEMPQRKVCRQVQLHPFRRNAPVRAPYQRGGTRRLDDVGTDKVALSLFKKATFAHTTRQADKSRRKWWLARCKPRGISAFPVTPSKFKLAAALLVKGRYRSGLLYLHALKRQHLRRGGQWTELHQLVLRDAKRVLSRGIGPPRQAAPLALELFVADEWEDSVAKAARWYWPAAGVDAVIVTCAWLTREIEASSAFLDSVTLHPPSRDEDGPCGWAEWLLPVSKADVMALGKTRSLSCACPSRLCPVRAMRQVLDAADRARQRKGEADITQWPLLVDTKGAPMEKQRVVQFYIDLMQAVNQPTDRISGHSARVTGARRMAVAGHIPAVIQMFGRWASSAVFSYTQEAILGVRGGTLAKKTEQAQALNADDLSARVLSRCSRSLTTDKGTVQTIIDRCLESLAQRALPQVLQPSAALDIDSVTKNILRQVMPTIHQLRDDLEVVSGSRAPKFVRNTLPTGRCHISIGGMCTLCGWVYQLGSVAVMTSNAWEMCLPAAKCKKCIMRAGLTTEQQVDKSDKYNK